MLEKYTLNNILFSYDIELRDIKSAKITLLVNNILNKEYINRAWIYRFSSAGWDPTLEEDSDPYINKDSDGFNMIGYFPQATRNYLLGLTLSL